MKIKKEKLKQIVREAIYQEATQHLVTEGKIEEFLSGLFGKKKSAKQPATQGGGEEARTQEFIKKVDSMSDEDLYNELPDAWQDKMMKRAALASKKPGGPDFETEKAKIMHKWKMHPEVKKDKDRTEKEKAAKAATAQAPYLKKIASYTDAEWDRMQSRFDKMGKLP